MHNLTAFDGSPLIHSLKFLVEIDQLKSILRQTVIMSGERRENSAEHSWQLAMGVLSLAHFAPELNVLKAVKMGLIHDIVEIDAGDTFVYDIGPQSEKFETEKTAAIRIFSLLKPPLSNELIELWEEFEKKQSLEARFVGAIDRFLPMLCNYLNNGHSWTQHKVSEEKIRALIDKWRPDFPLLAAEADTMIDEGSEKNWF